MRYTTISYSGLDLDTFLGESGKCYVTLTSAAKGLGISRQNIKDWVKNHCTIKGIPVQVGKFKSAATAYPVSVLREFLEYRVSLGDQQATALVFTSFEADVERSIMEANGIQVTATQQEEVRTSKRLEYLQQWVADNYQAVRPSKFANYNRLEESEMVAAGFTDPVEQRILGMEAYIKKTRQFLLDNPEMSEEQQGYYTDGIRSHEKQVQTLAQSLSN